MYLIIPIITVYVITYYCKAFPFKSNRERNGGSNRNIIKSSPLDIKPFPRTAM